MGVVLQVASGTMAGRRMHLLAGQVLQVGRTEWSDFAIPGDAAMADVHFTLQFQGGGCRLRDLGAPGGTIVNGKLVTETQVRHGDRITAGKTTFQLIVEGTAVGSAAATGGGTTAAGPTAGASGFVRVEAACAAEICTAFQLDADAQSMLTETITPRAFVERLVERELWSDALRFMAHALPKREAVWWACQCVRSAAGPAVVGKDAAAIAAAEAWVKEPTEEHRVAAMRGAEGTRHDTAAGWAAAAAAWSGGSLTAPELPVVPPGPWLTAQAAFGAIRFATIAKGIAKASQTQGEFVAMAVEIADAKNSWDGAGGGG